MKLLVYGKALAGRRLLPEKLLLIMRLTAILLITASLHVSANSFSQNITISAKRIKLEKVFKLIEEQTGFSFLWNENVLNKSGTVTLDVKGASLSNVLDICFRGMPLSYKIMDKVVLIELNKMPSADTTRLPSSVQAVIDGTVLNENGEPVQGASVVIKGSTTGTTTDKNGSFRLNSPPGKNTQLEISGIGYRTQVIEIGNRNHFPVTLQALVESLTDAVVVGYGQDTKRKLVSAVSVVKTDNIVSLPYTNMADALAGRAPGVITQSAGGEPGNGYARLAIRGGAGPDQAEPLYVIDNIISTNFDFVNLQPQDIASISILKDGSATAVYGSRGANGIILVTTRRGQKGKMNVNFSTLYELSTPTVLPKRINGYDYAVGVNAAATSDGQAPIYSPGKLDTIKNQLDPYILGNTDWYALALRKYTPQVKYALDMSGGSEKTDYFISLSAFDQGSNYKTDVTNMKRYTVRSNITNHFDQQGITLGINVYGTYVLNSYPAASAYAIWSHLQNASPLTPPYNKDGTYAAAVDHPLVDIDPASGYTKSQTRDVNGNITLDWNLPWVKGLKVGVLGYVKSENDFFKNWNTRAPQYDNLGNLQQGPTVSLLDTTNQFSTYTWQSRIEYGTRFGRHTISALALYEQTESRSDNFSASRTNYNSTAVDQLFAGGTEGINNTGDAAEGGRKGYVGRVKYDYASRYMIEFSGRYDGSDNLPSNLRWGFFPSVAVGWALADEDFFRPVKERNIFNTFKLRYSIAKVGSDAGISRFPYLSNYSLNQNVYVVGGSLVNGFSAGSLVDPSALTWYSTRDYNTGIDFGSLKNKLTGTAEYFYRRTTGFITSPKSRYTTPLGASLPQINSNSAYRRAGWEFQLNYADKAGAKKEFTYSVGGNLTVYKELWERDANEDSVTLQNPLSRVTHETDYWGVAYIAEGRYQSENEIHSRPRLASSSDLAPGDLYYKDVNGDGKIDVNDQVRVGHSGFPRLVYGLNLSFGYKTLSLDMLWQGTGARSYYLSGTLQPQTAGTIVYDFQKDFWTPSNPNAAYPRESLTARSNNYVTSTFWLVDARYLRLKSLRLAFDVKKQFPAQLSFLGSCLLTLNATNLLTFSPSKKYFDPETSSTSNYGYPTQKVVSLGINIGL